MSLDDKLKEIMNLANHPCDICGYSPCRHHLEQAKAILADLIEKDRKRRNES